MNNALRDTEARSYRECLLPSMARTSSITQVMPAKKITFFKRGDPQFSGVRLAVHQRTFKSFTALMDELSQRMPLSFGVRSVTTPQGLHCLTTLEQLEDGGCYLCSDKKHPQVLSGSGRLQRRHLSAQPLEDFKGRCEVPGTSSSWKDPKAPKRIILVKNTDPRFQRTVVLSHRNTRSLTAFLSKASDLLHFPVKQVFTISGKKVDSLQNLLNSPLVLVCAGHESFRPPSMEDSKRNGTETLSGLTSRNKNGSWGLKTKQSIIHSRSKSGSRSRRFSLLSEKSGLSDPSVSLHHTWMGSALHWHPRDTPVHTGPLVADNDFEKKVHMNEDGSLSVEMKVRFHLFNEDTLLWSTGVRRASTLTTASGERVDQGEVDHLHCVWKGSPGSFSEPGALGLKPCESGGEEAFNQGQQAWPSYEIWTNPLYRSQVEEIDSGKRAQLTQHSRPSWSQGAASRKRTSKASVSSASNDRPAAGSEPNSYCPRSLEGSMGSCREHQASRAASKRGAEQEAGCIPQAGRSPNLGPNSCPKGAEGSWEQQAQEEENEEALSLGCLEPGPCGIEGALPDSSVTSMFLEQPSDRSELCWGCVRRRETVTLQQEHTQEGSTYCRDLHPSSLGNGDLQAEESGQSTGSHKARCGSVKRLPMALGHSRSWDAEGCSFPLSSCASVQRRRRKQKSQASAVSLPNISGFGSVSQRSCHRQHHHQRLSHCLLDSVTTKQALSLANRGRACSDDSTEGFPENSSSARKQVSKDPGSPSSGSLHSQNPPAVISAIITPVSNSDPQKRNCASHFYHPHFTSAESDGNPDLEVSSSAPTPSNTSDSFSSYVRAGHLDKKSGGNIPKLSSPLIRPVKWPDRVKLGDHRGSCCSQLDTSQVCMTHGGKMLALQASQSQDRPQPISGACLKCSRYCPTPPRRQSFIKKHSSSSSSNGNINQSADWGPGGGEQGEEQLNGLRTLSLGSKSRATERTVRATRRSSPSPSGMSQGKISGEEENLEEQEDSVMMLSALPHISPEILVYEWLSHIPEDPILLKYEMMEESPNVAGNGPETTQDDPVYKQSLEDLGELAQSREQPLEGETSDRPELYEPPVTDDASSKSEEALSQREASRYVSDACAEARASNRTIVGHGVGEGVLPSRIPASIQIMKTLISSKQVRPSSLPEVSSVVGQRLSHSACALITCLARLHFFDKDFGSPSKVRFTDSPQFQELLATFKSLWPPCNELDLDHQEIRSCQVLPGFTSHAVTEDFTPTSSSGVDVSSGSGGSGEGSGPCPVECTLTSERMELPLKVVTGIISYQRPDSRTSEHPEYLRNQHLSCSKASSNSQALACITSQDEAGENSREQMLGNSLDQLVENTVHEEGVQEKKIKEEIEKEEMPEEQSKEEEFPEEKSIKEQELSVNDTQDGEGTQEDMKMQKEEAGRDPDSVDLCPPEMSNKLTESCTNPSESDSHVSEHQSGPTFEPDLKKLPRNAEMAREQTQVSSTQGAGEKNSSIAHRVSLDPDPIWVFKLLKKMEKAFMTHFANSMVTIRARWGLQNNYELDQMVAELEQDVSSRLQDSVKKELRKIQSRAGRKESKPLREALQWETSLQTEQRRRRLHDLRNLSAFTEQTRVSGLLSLALQDEIPLNCTPGTELTGKAEEEEFCPCEACIRKKVGPTFLRDTIGTGSAPIKKAFDLQQILQNKKEGCTNGEAAKRTFENGELGLLHNSPARTRTVQGADGGLEPGLGLCSGSDEGDKDEGNQKLSRVEDLELKEAEGASYQEGEEDPGAQKRDRKTDTSIGNDLEEEEWEEQGVNEKEENLNEGSGNEDNLEGEVSGKGERGSGREGDGIDAVKAQEAEGEEQTESEDKKEDSSPVSQEESQLGEASENSSPDQEGRPTPLSTSGRDTPHQRSASETGTSSSSFSSLGNCSEVSQKGSEEEHSSGDTSNTADEPKEVPHPDRKVTRMYLESSASEQEGAHSGPSTLDQEADENPDLEGRKIVKSLTFTKLVDRTDEFGQDDLDF